MARSAAVNWDHSFSSFVCASFSASRQCLIAPGLVTLERRASGIDAAARQAASILYLGTPTLAALATGGVPRDAACAPPVNVQTVTRSAELEGNRMTVIRKTTLASHLLPEHRGRQSIR